MTYADVKASLTTLSSQIAGLSGRIDSLNTQWNSIAKEVRNISEVKCKYKDSSTDIINLINTLDKSIGIAFGDVVTRISKLYSVAEGIQEAISNLNIEPQDNDEILEGISELSENVEDLLESISADVKLNITKAGMKIDEVKSIISSMDRGYSKEALNDAMSKVVKEKRAILEAELGISNFRKGIDVEFIVSSEEVDTSVTFNMREVEVPEPCTYSTSSSLKNELGQFVIKIPAEDTLKLNASRYRYGLVFYNFDGRAVDSRVGFVNVLKEA